jgi:subtilisin family serine protease
MAEEDAFMDRWLPTYPKVEDLFLHGTVVAQQVVSNAIFLAGVTARVTLIGVKVLDRNNFGFFSGILVGVLYAADQGADVANMSLRIRNGLDKRNPFALFAITNRVFNYAHRKGMVMVVIPGNESQDMDHDSPIFRPYCDAPHVICVSATGPTASADPFTGPWQNEDALAPYSNFGKAITVSAPGGTRQGWITSECARHAVFGYVPNTDPPEPIFPCLTPTPNSVLIIGVDGTSLAAPHVSALAALLVEDLGKHNPAAVKAALVHYGVDDLGPKGDDPQFGAGRINVAKALRLE